MAIEPYNWNAVVNGYWNLAILTPAGIAKHLFQVAEDLPVQVEVPLDMLAPYRIKNEDVIVVPNSSQIIVEAQRCEYGVLEKAKAVAANALRALQQTPVSAAGFNIRYRVDIPTERLTTVVESSVDHPLSDNNYNIARRSLQRSLAFRQGTLNIGVTIRTDGPAELFFNFDRQSSNWQDLAAWLELPIAEIRTEVEKILPLLTEVQTQERPNA